MRERQTDRQREGGRDRQTDRQRERVRGEDRQTDRERERVRERQTDRQTNREHQRRDHALSPTLYVSAGLVKAKKYNWKDSNVAMFGSDTDREVKSQFPFLSASVFSLVSMQQWYRTVPCKNPPSPPLPPYTDFVLK